MKNFIMSSVVVVSAFASLAYAADNTAEIVTNGDQVILSDCSLLADDVTISLSTSVTAGYFCRTGVDSEVVIASCHQNGRTATRTVETPCTTATPVPTGQVACDGSGPAGSNVNVASNTGAAIFVGRTSGGAIGPQALNGSTCAADGSTLTQYLQ